MQNRNEWGKPTFRMHKEEKKMMITTINLPKYQHITTTFSHYKVPNVSDRGQNNRGERRKEKGRGSREERKEEGGQTRERKMKTTRIKNEQEKTWVRLNSKLRHRWRIVGFSLTQSFKSNFFIVVRLYRRSEWLYSLK